MSIEIERRFFTINDHWKEFVVNQTQIEQYYLSSGHEHYTLRIRLKNNQAFLTLKGRGSGSAHSEFEYEVPYEDGIKIKNELKVGHGVEKTRYDVMYEGRHWEIDCFKGANAPLVISEIEFSSENTTLETLPPWIGKEIFYKDNLSNATLAITPYSEIREKFIHFE